MTQEVIIVCGAGRCGSSLLMRMLEAGGVETHDDGNKASYECAEAAEAFRSKKEASFIADIPGKAVKILDPKRIALFPAVPTAWIWIRRNAKQQARSMAKFLKALTGVSIDVQKFSEDIYKDNESEPARLAKFANARVLTVSFEALLTCPAETSVQIAEFVRLPLNTEAMAACVIARPTDCTPDLSYEISRLKAKL